MLLNPFTFHTPESLEELCTIYSKLDNVRLQAGGTFLINALKLQKRKGTKTPEHVIGLHKVSELKGISADDNALRIGAMVTVDELAASETLIDNFEIFKLVCRNISTQPIRNMATIGGNLTCRYTWTEMPAVCIGLEATLFFVDKTGASHSLSAEDFFKKAAKTDGILTHISIPRDASARTIYRRVSKTVGVDIPQLSLLMKANIDGNQISDIRVAINNCVGFAQRDYALEDFLRAKTITPSLVEEALDHAEQSIYDTRSSDYKKHMFRVSLESALEEILHEGASS